MPLRRRADEGGEAWRTSFQADGRRRSLRTFSFDVKKTWQTSFLLCKIIMNFD